MGKGKDLCALPSEVIREDGSSILLDEMEEQDRGMFVRKIQQEAELQLKWYRQNHPEA